MAAWSDVDCATVRDPRAYLVRLVTRQALNRLRTLKRRREAYVGPWLPEPLATTPDVADDVELADSVSIATATERSTDAVRQVASRARKHVQARRPRVEPPADAVTVAERFLAAAATGDLQQLLDVLSPDVVLLTDGGGKMQAALRPIHGSDKVARWFGGVRPRAGSFTFEWTTANGRPGVLFFVDGAVDTFATLTVRDGKVDAIYLVRNPDKLGHLAEARDLTRA